MNPQKPPTKKLPALQARLETLSSALIAGYNARGYVSFEQAHELDEIVRALPSAIANDENYTARVIAIEDEYLFGGCYDPESEMDMTELSNHQRINEDPSFVKSVIHDLITKDDG